MAYNSWLRAQRKTTLIELADSLGYTDTDGLKKTDLETALDEFITQNENRLSAKNDLKGYFNSRNKALGSPIKREARSSVDSLRPPRRRGTTKLSEELTPESDEQEPEPDLVSPRDTASASSTALVQTPARGALTEVLERVPLPATPAHIAEAVDRSAVAVRRRVSTYYQESGITEASHATRDALSTVTSVLFCVAGFELWSISKEILGKVYAFTIPAYSALGTPDYPVYVTDMFLLLTSSFWSPALTWLLTSIVLPCLAGWFFNLRATSAAHKSGRPLSSASEHVVDPLTFSIAKALVSYVVYAQGVTFNGLLTESSIQRLETAVYGGYKGILVGTAITGLVSIYDAVLGK